MEMETEVAFVIAFLVEDGYFMKTETYVYRGFCGWVILSAIESAMMDAIACYTLEAEFIDRRV
jgi:hypothetical protein